MTSTPPSLPGPTRKAVERTIAALTAVAVAAVARPALVITLLAVAAVLGVAALLWRFRPSARLRRRIGTDGWLDVREYRATAGPAAVRGRRRPGLPARPVSAAGARVGRLVSGPAILRRRPVYTPWKRGVLVLGPQGSGKSSLLVGPIRECPGPAYVTSTKTELVDMTATDRAQLGPVHVFNPTGLGSVASTLRWDPVAGCVDPGTADARARALVRGGGGATGTQNADFWAAKASEILRCYLLAAALEGHGMGQVMAWALHPQDRTPAGLLSQYGTNVPVGWLGTLEQNLAAAPNTRSGYFAALAPAVAFMDNPTVAAACRPGAGEGFDIAAYLRSPGTLYVIAGEGDQRIAPLLTALTEAVFSTAKQVAALNPGGQLDPPLGLFLDEIANITPVPLDNWAADSRGWGITVWAVAQDLAQLETRWGRTRAHTIFANLPTRIVLPGVAAREDLEHLAYLAGQRTVVQTSEGRSDNGDGRCTRSRNQSQAREPVVTGHIIYGLPRWHAYVLGLGTKPAIVRFEPGWRRRRRRLIPVPPVRRPGEAERVAPVTLTAVPDPVEDAA